MSKKNKEQEPNLYHLGSPDYIGETYYHSENCEFAIILKANKTNEAILGKDGKHGDEFYLGLNESDYESLFESMMFAMEDRLQQKLDRYKEYKKLYYKE
tara:strand:+ start:883 stop:1179 length:297 start_codon:yes stop_codon:yes gene_type:complete